MFVFDRINMKKINYTIASNKELKAINENCAKEMFVLTEQVKSYKYLDSVCNDNLFLKDEIIIEKDSIIEEKDKIIIGAEEEITRIKRQRNIGFLGSGAAIVVLLLLLL